MVKGALVVPPRPALFNGATGRGGSYMLDYGGLIQTIEKTQGMAQQSSNSVPKATVHVASWPVGVAQAYLWITSGTRHGILGPPLMAVFCLAPVTLRWRPRSSRLERGLRS